MIPIFETIAVVVIAGVIVLAVRLLAAGSEAIIEERLPPNRQLPWPRGVQEEDAPRFVFNRSTWTS